MFEFTKDSYILGIWFSSNKNNEDWMCAVQKEKDSDTWNGKYRTRIAKDGRIFDHDDEKRWVSFKSKDKTEEEMIRIIDDLQAAAGLVYPDKDKLMIQGDINTFMEKITNSGKDWLHMKCVPADEIDKYVKG